MYKRAFLFNGIGSKPEKLLLNMPPELKDKYEHYLETAFSRLGLNMVLDKNKGYDLRVADWIISLISDRVVFEHYTDKGIFPDIGAGYSSGIISISSCFGSISHEFAHDILMMTRSIMSCIDNSDRKLDMGIVIGFSYNEIREIIADRFSPDELIIGSGNSEFHVMISGAEAAVEKAISLCRNEGALKAFSYGMGMAYHHPVMRQYSQQFVDFCASERYDDPFYPILSIFDRQIKTTGEQIMHENQINVFTPIRWDLAIKRLEELGVTEFFDVSADGAVSKFSRVNKKCKIYTLEAV